MALGLGLGLPFSAGRGGPPPQAQALRYWGEAADLSGADVASWPGRAPGNATFTAAGGERPDASGGVLVFNGADRMTLSAASLGLSGATKATVAFWVKLTSAGFTANDTIFSSDSYPNSIALANNGGTAGARWQCYIGGASRNGSADGQQLFDGWQFVCASYDGTQGTDDARVTLYTLEHGQSVPTVLATVGAGIPTAIPAAVASAAIGDLPAFNRVPPMALAALYAYREAALTSSEAVTLSRRSDPLKGRKAILPLGDSLVLGVGDGGAAGGFRSDLLTLAGSTEAWWYHGETKNYTANAPNNRHSAVGGSKVDAHLTQWDAALAAGWTPDIVLYCGGRNDISALEIASLPARYSALFAAFGGRPAIVHTVVPGTAIPDADTIAANAHLATAAAAFPNVTVVTSAAYGAADGVHPDATNYALMADAYWAALEGML